MSSLALIAAQMRRQSLGEAARRHAAVEIDGRNGRQQTRRAFDADRHAVDFLEAARAVGEEALAAVGGARRGAFLLPCCSVGLGRHIGKWIQTIFWLQLDLVDRLVVGVLALLFGTRRPRRCIRLGAHRVRPRRIPTGGRKTARRRPLPAPRDAGGAARRAAAARHPHP